MSLSTFRLPIQLEPWLSQTVNTKVFEVDKKTIRFLAVLLCALFWIILICFNRAHAQHEHEYFTDQQIRITWEASESALGYYWYVKRIDDNFLIVQDVTSETEVHFIIQSAGLYVFYVRAWKFEVDGETIEYSGWANSLTHGLVDGVIRAWQIKIKLKPVGPLILMMNIL